jgi:hypothetical protein
VESREFSIYSTRTTMKRKRKKRTPEEIAYSEALGRRLEKRIAERNAEARAQAQREQGQAS